MEYELEESHYRELRKEWIWLWCGNLYYITIQTRVTTLTIEQGSHQSCILDSSLGMFLLVSV